MRTVAILIFISLGLSLFGYWGMFTHAGAEQYDEMDGLIPFGSLLLSVLLFLIALVYYITLQLRKIKKK